MEEKIKRLAIEAQRTEITEHYIYYKLAQNCKDTDNAKILRKIGDQEKGHYNFWKAKTGIDVGPDKKRIWMTTFLVKILGLSFVLKQMEKREGTGSKLYDTLSEFYPETKLFSEEEKSHEQQVLSMLNEERLQYVGSMVLGLNDALVELTGSLAGFTLALGSTKIISLAGLVTGISAALSMAASDYLSSKAKGDVTARKSAVYTGVAYLITVILLILPFLLLTNKLQALAITIATVVLIIYLFNYYIATAKDLDFKSRFWEMTSISLGVAAFSFVIGFLLKNALGIDV
ncbi:VIT1/CCC1 transporter family protein [Seramator thermalis]|uniref:VIT1/CCC1 transporter family protein n=1 Tax=Seramator thermalis TaxID=2496270 RepID=UPI00101C5350|nr:VIT1/CCC1 family protein [Seramator thermalis]